MAQTAFSEIIKEKTATVIVCGAGEFGMENFKQIVFCKQIKIYLDIRILKDF